MIVKVKTGIDFALDESVSYTIRMVVIDGHAVSELEAVRALTFEQLVEIGLCECGQWLDHHDPVPVPAKIQSWHAIRHTDQPWRNTITGRALSPAQLEWSQTDPTKRQGTWVRICRLPGCGKPLPDDRAANARYHSKECATIANKASNAEYQRARRTTTRVYRRREPK